MSELTIMELCAGYGGLAIGCGFAWPDSRLVAVAEVDRNANKVLAKNHPDIPNLGDISRVNWDSLDAPDILCGGTPCQDISVAGNGEGITGRKSSVWFDMALAVERLHPRIVLWENVSRALTMKSPQEGETVAQYVEGFLTYHGYQAATVKLEAQDVGAPHKRARVFILGIRGDIPAPHPALPLGITPRKHHALPTPTVVDMGNNKTASQWEAWKEAMKSKHGNGNGHGRSLAQEVQYNLGAYQDAINLWEHITGQHPKPVDDKGMLTPEFVEWMMGLPQGWVTGADITRNAKLKLLGNGVVPLQAQQAIYEAHERIAS